MSDDTKDPVLEVENLVLGYGDRVVLRDINFTVGAGEVVAILGTNGAGKSTLLNTLAGLHKQLEGHIRLEGEQLDGTPAWTRPARGLALVAEGQQTFPSMTVMENLWVGSQVTPATSKGFTSSLERVFTLFPRLADRRKQVAGTLSGGERQMLAIGRALLSNPRLLMLDEPSQGLAPIVIEQIADLIDIIAETTSLLIVEQNLLLPRQSAERVLVLDESRIVVEGPAAEILASDFVRETYLGSRIAKTPSRPRPVPQEGTLT